MPTSFRATGSFSNFRGGRATLGLSRGTVKSFVGSGKGTRGAGQLAFEIHVLGDWELERTLKLVPKVTQGKALRPALRAGAKVIRNAARRLAPKATGKLSRGITIRSIKRSRTKVGMRIVTPTRKRLGLPQGKVFFKRSKGLTRSQRRNQILVIRKRRGGISEISRDQWGFYYPAAVEFGTKHVAARPFMRTAYLTKRRSALVVIRAELWKRLRKEVIKLGQKQVAKLLREGSSRAAGAVADSVRGAAA